MEPKEKRAFEPTGLVPRSIVRTFERFRQQLLPGSEGAAIREYRISRYQVLVSARCLFILLTIPIATNWLVSSWLLSPIIEHFWNTQQNEIFLNAYQEERAFTEMESFSEKLFFESLLSPEHNSVTTTIDNNLESLSYPLASRTSLVGQKAKLPVSFQLSLQSLSTSLLSPIAKTFPLQSAMSTESSGRLTKQIAKEQIAKEESIGAPSQQSGTLMASQGTFRGTAGPLATLSILPPGDLQSAMLISTASSGAPVLDIKGPPAPRFPGGREEGLTKQIASTSVSPMRSMESQGSPFSGAVPRTILCLSDLTVQQSSEVRKKGKEVLLAGVPSQTDSKTLPIATTQLLIKQRVQDKILELAVYYNQQTISSITNVAGDLVSALTLACLFVWMKPEISILKSFLVEAIYSLSDTTKSFLLILLTDLLVGFHSPRGWETALEVLLKHFGLPENQDFVFLFVATFPVLLDTVFKYWIFRHLNKISPSTVATYHSMIE